MIAAARRRLVELLRPTTAQEVELIDQLGQMLDLQRLLVLTELISYRLER